MSLAAMRWRRVSLHSVVLAWLRAERESRVAPALSKLPELLWRPGLGQLLDEANLVEPEENRARLRLLYFIRSPMVVEIPPDTVWHRVESLTADDLPELRVVNVGDWTEPSEKNDLFKVAARKKLTLLAAPSDWETPILWGHDRKGPFTILEGNTRLVAYAGSGRHDLNIPVFIGLSPIRCLWHGPDGCGQLMQDLFAK